LFINGRLESFLAISGEMNESAVDLEIGQIMQDDPSYSLRGVLDEIQIYDYSLSPDSIASESGVITSVDPNSKADLLDIKIYPNPGSKSITVDMTRLKEEFLRGTGKMSILDIHGRELLTSFTGQLSTKTFDISSLQPGLYVLRVNYQHTTIIKEFIIQ